jgi:hypothetical protein
MSGSPKMTNRLPLPVFFRSSAMCRSAFMRALSTGCGRACELGGVGVVVEGAGDQHVEAGVAGLAGGGDQVGRETVPNSGPMKMAAASRFRPSM